MSTSLEEFRGGTPEAAANEYIEANLSGGHPNATQSLVVVRDDPTTLRTERCLSNLPPGAEPRNTSEALGPSNYTGVEQCRDYLDQFEGVNGDEVDLRADEENVLTKEVYLQQLHAQRALMENRTVNRTLLAAQRPLSIANVVAIIAIRRAEGSTVEEVNIEPRPPLEEQISALESLGAYRTELYTSYAIGIVLTDYDHTWPEGGGFAFVPTSYEANQKTARASTIVVSHRKATGSRELEDAQVAMEAIVDDRLEHTDAIAVGDGIIDHELRQSALDSLLIVGPVGALFVLLVLLVAYRDVLDVLLGVFGVGLVLLWTFGYMGWAGVTFNQLFVAVPVFLMGLSIDFAIHVFMRYREERASREAPDGPERVVRSSMAVALAGVGAALVLVTATTATGFLSNLASGVAPIREFAVVSAVGIVAALVVFGTLIPALKVEFDAWLEVRGYDRGRRAFGTSGPLSAVLAGSIAAAKAAPWAVVALALLAAFGGVYGATTLDTSFEDDDLLVDEVPGWAQEFPEPFRPGEYSAQSNLRYVEESNFVYRGSLTEILVRGDLTQPDTLERVKAASDKANRTDVVLYLPNRHPGTRSVVTTMHAVAGENESFNRTLHEADTDGDDIPDRNLEQVYDAFYATAPEAASVWLHREEGEYRAIRIRVPVNASFSEAKIARQVRLAPTPLEGNGLRPIATGDPVQNQAVTSQLLATVVESLAITLAVVLVMLVAAYHRSDGAPTLGAVTLLPVLLAVAWILGTMALLDIPFNVMTALITSFTIGLGVDYTIHVSERYVQELGRRESVDDALRRSVLGTGGALLGSATTTAGGFGVLAFAILAPLQQFGIVTGLTIVYSFLASVFVLPSMLAIWTRYTGFAAQGEEHASPVD